MFLCIVIILCIIINEQLVICCRVSLQNLTNHCAFIQDAVLGALRGNNPPTHVATFGDSSITVVGDWVTIQGLYNQPAKVG